MAERTFPTITIEQVAKALEVENPLDIAAFYAHAVMAVKRHAPYAPVVPLNEAVILIVGYLVGRPETDEPLPHWRTTIWVSGAEATLAPYAEPEPEPEPERRDVSSVGLVAVAGMRTAPPLRSSRLAERAYDVALRTRLLARMQQEYAARIMQEFVTQGSRDGIIASFAVTPEYPWLEEVVGTVPAEQSRRVVAWHTTRFRRVMSRYLPTSGITTDGVLAMEAEWIAENVRLIRTIPPRYHDSLRAALEQIQPQAPFDRQALREVFSKGYRSAGVNIRRITRDQTTKYVGRLNQARQTEVGIDRYQWQTSLDERVRPTHRANEGLVFYWNDPPQTGPPGYEINCRCVAIPIL